ncbi:uncharacterized protein TRAVEDRAFT_51654 [Trametes versicolor FP-101664 SS1]|uniref:uncharacterized protein n=1 Tax=Trametes versicolor (strain FP-101664) TaxID=717944 RepID=UPI00046239C4|nr:uncharacterized protein TRAVEDRAFT_51654 [Trametes versicolor FP-101664 SS1]EIW53916.1 hypothetical protein TRAVEDRAFT_51654 [Trametes versicolor FP-101664 SS1]
MSTTATSATASASSTVSPAQSKSATALALGISLAVVAILVVGGLAVYFVRRRHKAKRDAEKADEISAHRRTYMVSVDPNHLAARVTPFGVDAPELEVPKFVHQPGQNMRVAYRRSDGGWEFTAEPTPSQSLDLTRDLTMYSRTNTKEKKLRPGELTTRGYVEPDVEGNPPPAYYHDGSLFSDSTGH